LGKFTFGRDASDTKTDKEWLNRIKNRTQTFGFFLRSWFRWWIRIVQFHPIFIIILPIKISIILILKKDFLHLITIESFENFYLYVIQDTWVNNIGRSNHTWRFLRIS
jgi:hypothetical protein